MKLLHILKSEPDGLVADIMVRSCQSADCETIETFRQDVHWGEVVEKIFASDKVICWW